MNRKVKFALLGVGVVLLGAGTAFFVSTQIDDTSAIGVRAAPPPPPPAEPAVKGAVRMAVAESGNVRFVIDAPEEKIKGRWGKLRGQLDVEPTDLRKTTGQIDVDLADTTTETFDDAAKNLKQTEHARNWFELGTDVPEAQREQNRWARFTVEKVDEVGAVNLASVAPTGDARTVHVTASGHLWLHGVTSPKTVKLVLTLGGPAERPTSLRIATEAPMPVSMKEHDVKPRDVVGRFLKGASEKVGAKIVDDVQIFFEIEARAVAGAEALAR
ncbi:MAG: YceI family protein [Myxococcales bacterium]|nr:YceI family protein [Myxococcales bacterium]